MVKALTERRPYYNNSVGLTSCLKGVGKMNILFVGSTEPLEFSAGM